MNKKIVIFSLILSLSLSNLAADDSAIIAFVDGCKAYSQGDWTSAIFSLKKAASFDSNNTPETYFMLINAEIYSGEYKNALDDCEFFFETFSGTLYDANIMYLKGRCLYLLGEYDKAVIVLSDFCHQYEDHDMYASALFWIGECFYACYQYDDAVSLYQRVVLDFPDDVKAPAAQYRIETINQRDREEKLLYLLKQTGEEYLFAKEEYEKQLKIYTTETASTARQKLYDVQERNRELEEKYAELERENEALRAENILLGENVDALKSENMARGSDSRRGTDPDSRTFVEETDEAKMVRALKQKAEQTKLLQELKQKAAQTKILMDEINDSRELGGNR